MDYYNILEIDKNASDEAIKKAYKKLALKYHPDKNGGNDEQFKKIAEAYDILSNPEKKNVYDSGGDPKTQNMNFQNQGNDIHNIFQQFFGNAAHNHFRQQRQRNLKKSNHVHQINIPLKDVHFGVQKQLKVSINKNCFDCKTKCTECNGSGQKTVHRQMGPMMQVISHTCNVCSGSGKSIKKNNCDICKGTLEIKEEKIVVLDITKGFKNNTSILFESFGEQPQEQDEIAGDLLFQINILTDSNFKRKGDTNDLEYTINVSLLESIIGKHVTIPHFDGNFVFDTSTFGIINPNEKYIVNGKGLCNIGDLILKFKISYPIGKIKNNTADNTESDVDKLINIFKNIRN